MSEFVGVKTGELHTVVEVSEYYCARCGYPVSDHDSYCRECGGAFQEGFADKPFDRDALLALADELEKMQDSHGVLASVQPRGAAERIREACGTREES